MTKLWSSGRDYIQRCSAERGNCGGSAAQYSLQYKVLCYTLIAMRVKMILPALTEATSPLFRPIKYSLFPPLGLATLAAYLDAGDEVTITDEHVEKLSVDDRPELVVIQVY